jgi:hypothetical protein
MFNFHLSSILKIFIVVSFSQPVFLFQMPQSGAFYMKRPNDERKIQQDGPWAHHATEIRHHQAT